MTAMTSTYNGNQLSSMAGCASPDSFTSAGAKFLENIADSVIEAIDAGEMNDDRAAEIADNAPDIYTHTMWSEFVDLCAYQEDPTELGADASDMDKCARICLYMIAERLVSAIREDYTPDDDENDDDDGEDPESDG